MEEIPFIFLVVLEAVGESIGNSVFGYAKVGIA